MKRCAERALGTNFDHRRQWVADRMKALAGIFAIDICAYGLMSNHVILRIGRPRALGWTDAQVTERYEQLFGHTVQRSRQLPETARARTLARWRARLWDLSWFMRCLNESIARRANREDHCAGRFWEGRCRSQALLDAGRC